MASSSSSDRPQSDDLIYAFGASPGFDFASPGILFAARVSGLYRSFDAGKTWKLAYDSLGLQESLPTPAVAVFSNSKSKEQFEVFAGVSGGVLHSIDGGENWQIMRFGSPPPVVSALIISPNYVEDGILLAGTVEDGVFRSADRGSRWTAWNFGLLDLQVISLAVSPNFTEDETILVGTDSGVFRSTNGGRAWREVHLPVGYDPVLSLGISPHFGADRLVWAGTEANGLLVSSDEGESWEQVAIDQIRGPVNAILVSPEFIRNPDLLILQGEKLLISHDRGQSWGKWRENPILEQGVAAVFAPLGFGPQAPVLVGLSNGRTVTVR